jgi:predicted amidohydrolase YtcJ
MRTAKRFKSKRSAVSGRRSAVGRFLPQEAAADVILLGGNLITMDPGKPSAEALAIKDGRFLKIGRDSEVVAFAGRKTQTIHLRGSTVTPGFNDSHQHLSQVATELLQMDCSPAFCKTIGQIQRAVWKQVQKRPPGEWIRGVGYDDTKTADPRLLGRFDLDAVAPEHPVLIQHISGHWGVTNSKGLEMGGVQENTPDPKGGAYGRDPETGRLNGILYEQAEFDYVFEGLSGHAPIIPPFSLKERKKGLKKACDLYLAAGITSVTDALVSKMSLETYQEGWKPGESKLRVYMLITYEYLPHLKALGLKTGFGNEWLKAGGVKIIADGAIAGRTAFLSEPYAGTQNRGIFVAGSEESLHEAIWKAHEAGFQVCVHANGDRAITLTLDGLQKALQRLPRQDHRHRLEHCTVVNPEILQRMKRLKLLAVPFGSYIHHHGEKMIPCYGPERVAWMFAHRSFLNHGIPVSGSSDNPCGPYAPLLAIQSCVTRKSAAGEVLGAKQRISVEEAIYLYTLASAYASFEENLKGSLTPGKLADLVVLGEDPRRVNPDEIKDIPVEMTLVGGEIKYAGNKSS